MSAPSVSPAVRPLPHRPSLEYERKAAKALLRRLKSGDPEAVARARARHPGLDPTAPARARLADAQLVIAREYGFASWPRLVRWFGDAERQQHAITQLHGGAALYEAHARGLLADHRAGHVWAGRALAAYVPRFYGLPAGAVLAGAVTEEDARLAVARTRGAPSWAVLLERLDGNARTRPGNWEADPMRQAADAIAAADVGALERVVAAHPALLHPSGYDVSAGRTLMWIALGQERRHGADAVLPIMEWLAARGFDRQRELNTRLCRGHLGMTPGEVRDLLDQGADPRLVASNGIPVLEHALLGYWSGAAVDELAARATPRQALWIAAGLGDVDGVRRFLDRDGKPTAAARRLRPDFVAAGAPTCLLPLPDADDEELLVEALLVAVLNGRAAVIEYLASRGAPVNSRLCGAPLVVIAAGNGMTAAVEALVRGGADLDAPGQQPGQSAREVARSLFEGTPHDATRRRIVELCGMDPDAVLAERDARPVPPGLHPTLERALALARDDAARLGQPDMRPENLLVGLLRGGGPPLHFLKGAGWLNPAGGRLDVERLRGELADRVAAADGDLRGAALPMHADAQSALGAAVAHAADRRAEWVEGLHLLHALTAVGDGPAARLLARYGLSAASVTAELVLAL